MRGNDAAGKARAVRAHCAFGLLQRIRALPVAWIHAAAPGGLALRTPNARPNGNLF